MRLFIWGVLTPSCGDPFWDMPSIEVRIATCQNKRCIPNWGWFKTIQNPCARAPEKWYHRKPTPLEHPNALPSQSYKAWSLDWSDSWIDPTRSSEGHSSLLAIPRAPVDLIEAAGSFASDHAPSHLDRSRWTSVPLIHQGVTVEPVEQTNMAIWCNMEMKNALIQKWTTRKVRGKFGEASLITIQNSFWWMMNHFVKSCQSSI